MNTAHVTLYGFKELQAGLDDIGKNAVPVIRTAWRNDAKTFLRPKMQKEVRAAFHGKKTLARSYAISVTGRKSTRNVTMDFYSRAKQTVPHEYGALLSPKKGKYLTIPTKFVGKRTRAGRRGHARYFKDTFVKRSKHGNLIIFQKQKKDRNFSAFGLQGRGKFYQGEIIPLYVLKRSVFLRKRTNIRGFAIRMSGRVAKVALESLITRFGRRNRHGAMSSFGNVYGRII